MAKMISICGLTCSECGAFIATQKNDPDMRKKVAEEWSRQYNVVVKPEDIICDGCTSPTDRVFSYPRICEIRNCGRQKQVQNCAHCGEYACDKLTKFFELAPIARRTLEEIRNRS